MGVSQQIRAGFHSLIAVRMKIINNLLIPAKGVKNEE
jgi:hypothetical protein